MLPLIQNTQKSQIYRDRKQIRGYEGMGGGGNQALLLHGYRVSVWGDRNFGNTGDGGTTMETINATELYT